MLLLFSHIRCENYCDTHECDEFTRSVVEKREVARRKAREETEFLEKTVKQIEESCGEVCDTSKEPEPETGKYYPVIRKHFDCEKLFKSPDLNVESIVSKPLRQIPKSLAANFTHDGRIPIGRSYYDDAGGSGHNLVWTKENIDRRIDSGDFGGSYGAAATNELRGALLEHGDLEGKRVLVVGSQHPWVEALALSAGAAHVTTVDYVKIESRHPRVATQTPAEMAAAFLAGAIEPFDAVISFSSLEHSGMGRYGDLLNPWGDLMTMARAWCVTREGGRAFVGVPTGPDEIRFNEARIYGPLLYSHLFANWKQVHADFRPEKFERCNFCTAYQPIHVLEKESGSVRVKEEL